MRAAIYHRVSTVDQHADTADPALRSWCERVGATVVLSIEETGSGAKNNRPGLQRLLDAAKRGELDVVVVWKLCRFGRSALDVMSNLRTLQSAGVRFVITTQGIDIGPKGDAMGQLQFNILAAVAEFERELISERTREGLSRAKRNGRRLGRVPSRPAQATVARLRDRGLTWTEVAGTLKCSVSTARRALR